MAQGGGLDDSRKHGEDLAELYGKKLKFLPNKLDSTVSFRVTNNVSLLHALMNCCAIADFIALQVM